MDKLRQIAGVLLFSISTACGGLTSNETNGVCVIRVFNDSPPPCPTFACA